MLTAANRVTAYFVIGAAGAIGGGALLLFMIFLYVGPLKIIDLGLSENLALRLGAILCLLFFLQHSVMIRKQFRDKLARVIPPQYDAAFFAIVAGLFLFLLLFLWQGVPSTIIAPEGIWRFILRAAFFLSLAGFCWGLWSLGEFDPFGILPIIHYLRGTEKAALPFIARGPYRLVRHPLYTTMILMLWSFPTLTMDRLLFNFLFTTYMVVGTLFEERDLETAFGADYLSYQKEVPMLVPFRLKLFSRNIENTV